MAAGLQQRFRLSILFIFLLFAPAMTVPIPPVPIERTFLLGGFRHIGLSAAVQEAPRLLRTASKAPKYIKSAVKDAPKALNKLGPEDFLGSGVKRKSLTGLYSVAGAVGLGASSIVYNGINMKARQSEALRQQHRSEQTRQALCRTLQQPKAQSLEKRVWSDAAINTFEDYGKVVATTEGVGAGVLAVNSANQNLQRSRQPTIPLRC